MPALSPTMEKGNLAKWVKHQGDKVKSSDIIAEIETDKATMEVEAVDEGILARIVIPEGTDHVAVNTPIALIAQNGEDIGALALPRSAALSPSDRMVAIGVLTRTLSVPSGMTILASTPSSTASTSIVALSVSISAKTSPARTVSPSLLTQRAILPSVIVGESAGISTSLVIPFLGVIGGSSPARGLCHPAL